MQSIWVSRRVLCECSSIRARMHRGHVPGHKDLSWRGSGHEVVGLKFGAAFSNHSMCSFVSAVSRRRGLIITPTVPAHDRPVVIVICAAGHNGPDFFVEVLYPRTAVSKSLAQRLRMRWTRRFVALRRPGSTPDARVRIPDMLDGGFGLSSELCFGCQFVEENCG
jgi:hypothetical protein